MTQPRIASLYCYPVKGLSPQKLDRARLEAGAYFPNDRLYAVENGPSGFDLATPTHLPKTKFLMLMRNERLARLKTTYDPSTRRLLVEHEGATVCDSDLSVPDGAAALDAFLAEFCADDLRGAPKTLATREGFRFTDSAKGFVSLVNLASVEAVEAAVGRPLDPLRFRSNIYLSGLPAWAENAFVGRRCAIGEAALEIIATTDRCAATSVDPGTGQRDINVVATLVRRFGHNLCGVYARIVEGGEVRPGDRFRLLD